jgi:LacI family transcriptional regulator
VLTKHPSVSPDTRAKVDEVIREHGFQPNPFARGLAGGPTGQMAVVAAEINSGFYAEVLRGINAVVASEGGHLLSCIAHDEADYVNLWRTFAAGGRADGTILLAPPVEIFSHTIKKTDIPVILCACRPHDGAKGWNKVDTVTVDNEDAVTSLMQHLAEQGRKSFVHIAGPPNVHDAQARRAAFESFVKSREGLSGQVLQAGLNREDGYEAVMEHLEGAGTCPDAFVAFNDSTAYGVLQALKERDMGVPAKVAVTGCDDEPASAILGLTSLHMPMRELGEEAARLLVKRIHEARGQQKPSHTVLQMTPMFRGSSGG